GGGLVIATEVSEHPAPAAKRGVQAAIRVVPRQGEVLAATATGQRRHDNLTVRLDGERGGVTPASELGEHPAPTAKRGIQATVRVVPRQGEVASAGARTPRHHDPAVGLEGEGPGPVTATEVREHLAAGAKAGVEIARARVHRVREA